MTDPCEGCVHQEVCSFRTSLCACADAINCCTVHFPNGSGCSIAGVSFIEQPIAIKCKYYSKKMEVQIR